MQFLLSSSSSSLIIIITSIIIVAVAILLPSHNFVLAVPTFTFWPNDKAELEAARSNAKPDYDFYHLDNLNHQSSQLIITDIAFNQTSSSNNHVKPLYILISNSFFAEPVRFSSSVVFPINSTFRFENCTLRFFNPYRADEQDIEYNYLMTQRFQMNPRSALQFINCSVVTAPGQTGDDPRTLGDGISIRLSADSANYSITISRCTYSWVSTTYIRGEFFDVDQNSNSRRTPEKDKTLPQPGVKIHQDMHHEAATILKNYFFNKIEITDNNFETNHGWYRFIEFSSRENPQPNQYLYEFGIQPQLNGRLINISGNNAKVRYFDDPKKSWFWWSIEHYDQQLLGLNLNQMLSCDLILHQRNKIDAREFSTFHNHFVALAGFGIGCAQYSSSKWREIKRQTTYLIDSGTVLISDNDYYIEPGQRDFAKMMDDSEVTKKSYEWGMAAAFGPGYGALYGISVHFPTHVQSIQVRNNSIVVDGATAAELICFRFGYARKVASSETHDYNYDWYPPSHYFPVRNGPLWFLTAPEETKKNIGELVIENNTLVTQDSSSLFMIRLALNGYFDFWGDLVIRNNTIHAHYDFDRSPNPDKERIVNNYALSVHGIVSYRQFTKGSFQFIRNLVIEQNDIALTGRYGSTITVQLFGDEINTTYCSVSRNKLNVTSHDFERPFEAESMGSELLAGGTVGQLIGIRFANGLADFRLVIIEENQIFLSVKGGGVMDGGGIALAQNEYAHNVGVRNQGGLEPIFFFWNATVRRNNISIVKSAALYYEGPFVPISVAKYVGSEKYEFGFVSVIDNDISFVSTAISPMLSFAGVLLSIHGNNKMINSILIENNRIHLRGRERQITGVGIATNNRAAPDFNRQILEAFDGDSRFGVVKIVGNEITVINERGAAVAVALIPSKVVSIDHLVIQNNTAKLAALSSSESADARVFDRASFLSSAPPYGTIPYEASPGFFVDVPMVSTGGSNTKFGVIELANNRVVLTNHPSASPPTPSSSSSSSLSSSFFHAPPADWYDYTLVSRLVRPPACSFIQFDSGIVVDSNITSINDTVEISQITPFYSVPSGVSINSITSKEGTTSEMFSYTFRQNIIKLLKMKDFTLKVREYDCFDTTSNKPSFSNGFLFGLRLGQVPNPKWILTQMSTSLHQLTVHNVTLSYNSDEERSDNNNICSRNGLPTSYSKSSSEYPLNFIHLGNLPKINVFNSTNLTDMKISTSTSDSAGTVNNLFSTDAPNQKLSDAKQTSFSASCLKWNDEFGWINSDFIKASVPYLGLDRLHISPCPDAIFSTSETLSVELTDTVHRLSPTISPNTQTLSSSEEQLVEDYEASQAAANAVAVGQTAAVLSNVMANNPSLVLSISRAQSMQKLALCHINSRELSLAQKEMKFANYSTLVLSRELSFPSSLLPGLALGSETRGKYYRGAILSFILALVAFILLTFFEGTVNKSKWKAFCFSKEGKKSRFRYHPSISFFEYAHVDRFILKPIVILTSYWFDAAGALLTFETGELGDIFLAVIPLLFQMGIVIWFVYRVRKYVNTVQGEDGSKRDDKKKKKQKKAHKNTHEDDVSKDNNKQEQPHHPVHFLEESELYYPPKIDRAKWKTKVREILKSDPWGRLCFTGKWIWSPTMKYVDLQLSNMRAGPGPETQFASTFNAYQGPTRREKTKEELIVAQDEERKQLRRSNSNLDAMNADFEHRRSEHNGRFSGVDRRRHRFNDDDYADYQDEEMLPVRHHQQDGRSNKSPHNSSSSRHDNYNHRRIASDSKNNRRFVTNVNDLQHSLIQRSSSSSSPRNNINNSSRRTNENRQISNGRNDSTEFSTASSGSGNNYKNNTAVIPSVIDKKYVYDFSLRRKLQPLWLEITLVITMITSILSGISSVLPSTCATHFIITSGLLILNFILFIWLFPYILFVRNLGPFLIELFAVAGNIMFINLVTSSALSQLGKSDDVAATRFSTLHTEIEKQVQLAIAFCSFPASVIASFIIFLQILRVVFARSTRSMMVTNSVIRSNLRSQIDEVEKELLPSLRSATTARGRKKDNKNKKGAEAVTNNFDLF